jgi:hypothetical protein
MIDHKTAAKALDDTKKRVAYGQVANFIRTGTDPYNPNPNAFDSARTLAMNSEMLDPIEKEALLHHIEIRENSALRAASARKTQAQEVFSANIFALLWEGNLTQENISQLTDGQYQTVEEMIADATRNLDLSVADGKSIIAIWIYLLQMASRL